MKAPFWFGIHLVLGLWLIISPYALGFSENLNAFWNAVASGAVSLIAALAGMYFEREETGAHGSFKKTSSAV